MTTTVTDTSPLEHLSEIELWYIKSEKICIYIHNKRYIVLNDRKISALCKIHQLSLTTIQAAKRWKALET